MRIEMNAAVALTAGKKLRSALLAGLAVIALTACGGGGGDDPSPSSFPPLPPYLFSPTPDQTTTDQAFIGVSGIENSGAITWINNTTGATGTPFYVSNSCSWFLIYVCNDVWGASIPLALGSNNIKISVTDSSGRSGTTSITIQRVPDRSLPTVTSTWPPYHAQGIPLDANLSATFSESMDPATINVTSFILLDSNNNPVPGTVTYAESMPSFDPYDHTVIYTEGGTAIFDPIHVLASSSTYTAKITIAARDLAGGNPLASDFVWTFSTGLSQWRPTSTNGAPAYTSHTAIWNGTRMVVWGNGGTGASYDTETDTWQSISSAGAPSARSEHSAIWTGSEMIVWGGLENSTFTQVNTGGRYRPATNTWQPISTVNAPSPRRKASVIWTGTEMIVWGGKEIATFARLNNGASYNPLTDTWRSITTTGAPSGREGHTAVWTGTEMVIWGGFDQFLTWSNTGGRYDPAGDKWLETSRFSAPFGRNNHSAVWTGTHMIIWGGTSGSEGNPLNSGGRYNPATNITNSWQATTTVGSPSARAGHTAIWTSSEMFVWGGVDTSGLPVNTGGRYNPSTDRWSQMDISSSPSARSGHTGVWTGTLMIVWGGNSDNTGGRLVP